MNTACILIPLASITACLTASSATLFSESFGGGAGDLNGTTVDGTAWVAEGGFKANGLITGGGPGSATLTFTPVDGLIYTLDVSFGASTYPGGLDNDWLAIGFSKGQEAGSSNDNRFINNAVIGSAWMLQRGPGGGVNRTWLGTATSGTQNGEDWAAQTTLTGGNSDLRIVLDTTGGAGNWTAAFFAKGTSDTSFDEVRPASLLASEEITSVGIARSSADISGSVTSFTLTSIPEPSSLLLLGLGSISVLRRRR